MTKCGITRVSLLVRNVLIFWLIRAIVVDQCALRRDLSLFDAGDQTEVGEKGITLRCGALNYSHW